MFNKPASNTLKNAKNAVIVKELSQSHSRVLGGIEWGPKVLHSSRFRFHIFISVQQWSRTSTIRIVENVLNKCILTFL